MKTCLEVVTKALVKLSQVAVGGDVDNDEAQVGMDALQSIYDEFVGSAVLGVLTDVLIDADYEAGENERIQSTGGPFTVTLPTTIVDDQTGDTRAPRDLAVVVKADTGIASVYSAPSAAWQTLSGLDLTSDAPMSERSFDGLASLLAVRLAADFPSQITPTIALAASRFLNMVMMKLASARRETQTDYF